MKRLINSSQKEKIAAKIDPDENPEEKNDKLSDCSREKEKLLLLRPRENNKNKNNCNIESRNQEKYFDNKTSFNHFENEINKNSNKDKNILNKAFQTIKNYNKELKENDMIKSNEGFYKKKGNLTNEKRPKSTRKDRINIQPFNFGKNIEKHDSKIYKKKILIKNLDNFNEHISNMNANESHDDFNRTKNKNLQSDNFKTINEEDIGSSIGFNYIKRNKVLIRLKKS